MPSIHNPQCLFFTQSSLFHHITPQVEQKLLNIQPIISGQFALLHWFVRLELFPQILKLHFLTPQDQNESIPFISNLNYDIKASELNPRINNSGKKVFVFSLFQNNHLNYDFECEDQKLAIKWVDQLSKQVFLSGFSNNFRALKYIARGEFAQVWEMERLRDGKKFAVKIIDKEVSFGSLKGKEAVYNEIQILRKLNHPNIEHIECIYQSEKNIYLVLEYIPGFVLSDLTRKKRTGSESASSGKVQKIHNVNIMKNLLKAIKYLHEMGIAHRDIKPGNIIFNPSNNWKPYLIDFGLSEFTSKQQLLFQYCGSPGYMAPQIFGHQEVKDLQKCDIFSLGAIFYLLLTRQPLFDGNSKEQIIRQTKNSKNFINKKIKSLSSASEANLILQMLHQDPAKRLTADQALSHDFFIDASYDYLNELRKPNSDGEKTICYSVKQRKFKSKFEELFSESAIFTGFKLSFIRQEDKENANTSQSTSFNMVEPSQQFIQKIHRRSSRFMSEENIEVSVDMKKTKPWPKEQWSGKWKNFKTLDRVLIKEDQWNARDFNAF